MAGVKQRADGVAERKHKHLKAATRIGTIHGRHEYTRAEQAFHDKDVHAGNREKKREVLAASRKDILGLSKPAWDERVSTDEPLVERRGQQMAKYDPTLYKFNYRAEVLSKSNTHFVHKPGRHEFDHRVLHKGLHEDAHKLETPKRTEEAPVHPELADKAPWDGSTEINHKELAWRAKARTARSLRHSRSKSRRLENEGYVNPIVAHKQRVAEQRAEKERERAGIPKPESAATEAETKHEPKPDGARRTSAHSRKYKEYYNDGVFEYSKIDDAWQWSCSGNPNPDFRGSCFRVRNPDAWNFASP